MCFKPEYTKRGTHISMEKKQEQPMTLVGGNETIAAKRKYPPIIHLFIILVSPYYLIFEVIKSIKLRLLYIYI